MVEPEAVAAMLRLKELGWGSKRIARELGVNRRTVKRYLETGGWQPYKKPKRQKLLEGLETGYGSVCAGIAAMLTWCAKSSCPRRALLPVAGQCNAHLNPIARNSVPRRLQRCASRRHPASSYRSTSVSGW